MRVEFVSPYDHSPRTGIGRYLHTLKAHLEQTVDVSIKSMRYPPLAGRFSVLRNFPLAVENHVPGSIVHIPQIRGCALLLRNTYHPCIATVHDLGVLESPLDKPLLNRVDRLILELHWHGLKKADFLLVHSERTRRGLIRHLGIPEHAIYKVPSSIDADHFHPIEGARKYVEEKYQIEFEADASYLFYVGSELPRKNLKLLLEAMSILKSRGRKVFLIKVGGAGGDKWRAATIATAEQFGCLDNILFLGIVPEDDLPYFYNAADMCVTPTRLEGGFAWLAMEGMACARPVVATADALIPDSARDAALVVQEDDPTAFADAIDTLILNPEMGERMGRIGRGLITAYSWEAEAASTLAVYNELIKQFIPG